MTHVYRDLREVDNRTLADVTRCAEAREQCIREKLIASMKETERLLEELKRLRAEIKGKIEVES